MFGVCAMRRQLFALSNDIDMSALSAEFRVGPELFSIAVKRTLSVCIHSGICEDGKQMSARSQSAANTCARTYTQACTRTFFASLKNEAHLKLGAGCAATGASKATCCEDREEARRSTDDGTILFVGRAAGALKRAVRL